MPWKVSTLISLERRVGSLKIAAFTLTVVALSSKYWPVLRCVGLEAQPPSVVKAAAAASRKEDGETVVETHGELS